MQYDRRDFLRLLMNKLLFYISVALLIPYGLTMIMTGVLGTGESLEDFSSGIAIQIGEGEQMEEIDLEDYIIGTMASQIPADYEMEALKGQAIIQRTNILNEMEKERTVNSNDLPFLYLSKEEMREKWGEKNWENYYGRLQKAAADTAGIYMTYDGEYIEAYYHPVSIGTTVSAKELLGKEITYLQSVESRKDVESKDYMNMKEFSYEEAKEILTAHKIQADEETLSKQLAIKKKTQLGYVQKLSIGKQTVTGEQWAEWFSLSSTNFYLEDYEGRLRMVALGKGRGLGVSQYGANEMAKEGASYEEILKYYYNEIVLNKITDSGNAITRGDENEEI